MSLLDNLPHTATATRRTTARGPLGGSRGTYPDPTVFTARPCWQQQLTQREIEANDKRGIAATSKIYFTTLPDLTTEDNLEITNNDTGQTQTFEVRSRAIPDASAGLGILYRVYVELTTVGSTP